MRETRQINPVPILVTALATVATLLTNQTTLGQDKKGPVLTFGPSLQVGDVSDVGEVDLVVSPTGAVAAFVPTRRWPGHEGQSWMAYRVSTDGGRTWTGQLEAPMPDRSAPVVGTGRTVADNPTGVIRRIGLWEHMIRPPVWFSARYARFSNDLMSYQVEALKAEVPQAIVLVKEPDGVAFRTEKVLPLQDQNQVLRLSKSELLLAMHGRFKGENKTRAFLIRSLDGGRLWRTLTTIGYAAEDPDPKLPGQFSGFRTPGLIALPDGKLVVVMRSDVSRKPPFRPLYFSWSEDRGVSWSQPKPAHPHLFGAKPTLVVLERGLLACLVEQPGPAITLSTDGGRSWSPSQAIPGAATRTTGQVDMVRIGPARLLVLAAARSGGVRVFPITVRTTTSRPKKTDPRPTRPTEILEITQGKPVKLGPYGYVNDATLGVSPTGVIVAGVGVRKWPGMHEQWITYRVSRDGGKTWTEPLQGFGPVRSGAESWATLRGGGVLQVGGWRTSPVENRKGWWQTILTRFHNDMIRYQIEPVRVFMPDAGFVISEPSPLYMSGPHFGTGRVIQLPNGDLLSPMQGKFRGDTKYRVFVTRSVDRGRTWRFLGTIAYNPIDQQSELPGQYVGHAEASIALLPNGRLLSVMRTQYTQMTAEYRPLNASWSDDMGKTWSRPVATTPHLMAIHPNLIVLDNGVVACVYGRPGFHAVFSIDNGHTWQDRISFSHLPEPRITGQVHANKTGPNSLMVIGGVSSAGTQVFPLTVKRTRVPSTMGELAGRVFDTTGRPIAGATVQRGPNRYAADDWLEHETDLDTWKAAPQIVGNPGLAFRSIRKPDDRTTVQTDAEGRFRMTKVPLGEFILTVEARGHAPQHRHVTVRPKPQPHKFSLSAGARIRGRVVDSQGKPISGVCVVLDHWHCHTDREGYFHWSARAPLPKQVTVRVHKRYNDTYTTFKQQVRFSELERRPITLQNR